MECGIPRDSNLGEGPQDLRLRMGATTFALGLVLAVVMLKLGASPTPRLLLGIPFFLGFNFLYMGLFRTCSGLALQGLRDNGDGPTPIGDRGERARVRRTAGIVTACALLSSALAISLFMIV